MSINLSGSLLLTGSLTTSGALTGYNYTFTDGQYIRNSNQSNANGSLYLDSSNLYIRRADTGANLMFVSSSGNVGIGTTNPSFSDFSTNTLGINISNQSTNYAGLKLTGNTAYTTGSFGLYVGSAAHYLWGGGANPVIFATNETERMRILSNGSVAINMTTAPYGNVSIKSTNSTSYYGFNLYAANNGNFTFLNHDNNRGVIGTEFGTGGTGHTPLGFESGGAERMRIGTDGNVSINGATVSGIKTSIYSDSGTSSSYALALYTNTAVDLLNVRGDGYGYLKASAWAYGSDRRIKENINYIETGLDKILALKPATFDYIAGVKNNIGWIAQDVQEVIPEAVNPISEANDQLTLKSDFIIPYLVKAIQEQQTQIESQNTLIQELTTRLTALENK